MQSPVVKTCAHNVTKQCMESNIKTTVDKAPYLQQLETMSAESLKLLAELSKYPNIEKKLKANANVIKLSLKF